MVDWLKISVTLKQDISQFIERAGSILSVTSNIDTGEVNEYPIRGQWNGFDFVVKSERYMIIEGSLHKLYHRGHNHTDFTFSELCKAISILSCFTGIEPYNMHIHNLEFGLNVNTAMPAEAIIKDVICYKCKLPSVPIDSKTGYYTQYKHTDYVVKLYDKAKQYHISDRNILRYELKGLKQRFFADCGVKSLADLTVKGNLLALMKKLKDYFDGFVFDDSSLYTSSLNNCDKKVYDKWSNPREWAKIKKCKKQAHFASIKRFKGIVRNVGRCDHMEALKALFEAKSIELIES